MFLSILWGLYNAPLKASSDALCAGSLMLKSLRRALAKVGLVKTMTPVPTVGVFVTNDAIFVIAEKMTEGGRLSVDPMLRLERGTPPNVVGEAILKGLAAFQDSDDTPDRDGLRRLLEFVGARSWKSFAKGAINFSIAGLSENTVGLSPALADSRGAYLYRDTHECPREAVAIGEMLESLAQRMTT